MAAWAIDHEHIQTLLIALFIGALVGTERTLDKQGEEKNFVGLRTFVLVSEAGAIVAWISRGIQSYSLLWVGLVCITIVMTARFFAELKDSKKVPSLTTEIAAIVVYLLGAATVLGHSEFAVAMAIITSAVLALKTKLHSAVGKIRHEEWLAALRLLFATFIILPILPRVPIDPWGTFNPHRLWLLVVLISGLSMLGYLAIRFFGQRRGIAITAISGGLVSSTAVTLAFSKQSQESKTLTRMLSAGILLSWGVMFLRILAEISFVNLAMLPLLASPFVVMTLTCAVGAFFFIKAQSRSEQDSFKIAEVVLKNPFRLLAAVQFAAFFALVIFVSKTVQLYFPNLGLYIVAALAGTSDVDAITLSTAELVLRKEILADHGLRAIIVAAFVNTLVKIGLIVIFGSKELRKNILYFGILVLLMGSLTTWLTI